MNIEKVYFSANDDVQLFGLLHKTENIVFAKEIVLSVHGMTSNCFKKREDIFAQEFTANGIDYFCFNNRGSDIMTYYEKIQNGKLVGRIESGTANEVFEDCYHDIKGAILMLLNKGYETIYLQGHSYGSAKIVYTYQKMKTNGEKDILNHIKSITLLSIVDVPRTCRALLWDKYNLAITEAQKLVAEGKGETLIPRDYFLHPISARNFLFCNEPDGYGDLAPFGVENSNFAALNSIDCKLFMCWGKERDMILQSPEELETILHNKIKNPCLRVMFIEGTGHNYHYKEKETANEIIQFLKNF